MSSALMNIRTINQKDILCENQKFTHADDLLAIVKIQQQSD